MKVVEDGSKELKYVPITTNPIFTQKLVNYTPRCSFMCAIIFLFVLIVIFVAFGVPIVIQAKEIVEAKIDYTTIW